MKTLIDAGFAGDGGARYPIRYLIGLMVCRIRGCRRMVGHTPLCPNAALSLTRRGKGAEVVEGKDAVRRPRVAGGRQHQVKARFTDEEFQVIAARAAAARASVPAYLAAVGLQPVQPGQIDAATVRALAAEMMGLRRQVNRVGHNINQVAHLLHGAGQIAGHAATTYRAATAILSRIDPLLDRLEDYLPGVLL